MSEELVDTNASVRQETLTYDNVALEGEKLDTPIWGCPQQDIGVSVSLPMGSNQGGSGVCSVPEEPRPGTMEALRCSWTVDSSLTEKQNAVRQIVHVLQFDVDNDDEDAIQFIFSVIAECFAVDQDTVIRMEILEAFPVICLHCINSDHRSLVDRVGTVLIPLVLRALSDAHHQVRKISHAAVLILIEQGVLNEDAGVGCGLEFRIRDQKMFLKRSSAGRILTEFTDAIEKKLIPEVLRLSSLEEIHEDIRIEAASLLCKLVLHLERSKVILLILQRFTELCQDSLFHIRKVCASQLGELSKLLGQEYTEYLLVPHLVALSQDTIWGVRKSSAECFTDVSSNCCMRTRRSTLAPVFALLLQDSTRWVQSTAFQGLGSFIYTFAENPKTPSQSEISFVIDDSSKGTAVTEDCDVAAAAFAQKDQLGKLQLSCGVSVSLPAPEKIPPGISLPSGFTSPPSKTECRRRSSSGEDDDYMEIVPLGEGLTFLNSTFESENESNDQKDDLLSYVETMEAKDEAVELPDSEIIVLPKEEQSTEAMEKLLTTAVKATLEQISLVADESTLKEVCDYLREPERKLFQLQGLSNFVERVSQGVRDYFMFKMNSSTDSESTSSSQAESDNCPGEGNAMNNSVPNREEDTQFSSFLYWRDPNLVVYEQVADESETQTHSSHTVSDAMRSFMDRRFSYTTLTASEEPVVDDSEKKQSEMSVLESFKRLSTNEKSGDDIFLSVASQIYTTSSSGSGEEKFPGEPDVVNLKSATGKTALETYQNKEKSGSLDAGGSSEKAVPGKQINSHSKCSPSTSSEGSPGEYSEKMSSKCQDVIPQDLLDHFLSMVEPGKAQVENELCRHCAFSLPAVAFTIGPKNWHCLRDTYLALAKDMQWRIRRTIAFSIHELAGILGSELTESDLMPVFTSFLRDVDEVRIGVLRNLHLFLQHLGEEKRRDVLPYLADFLTPDNPKNWRFQHVLAEELILLCGMYGIEDLNEYFSPVALTLATEKVDQVRKVAHKLLATIIRRFFEKESTSERAVMELTDPFLKDIVKAFAKSEQYWRRRQTYVFICGEVMRERAVPEWFLQQSLFPSLLHLSQDRVPNVRIALANTLCSALSKHGGYFENEWNVEQIENIFKRQMLSDPSREVRQILCDFLEGKEKGPSIFHAGHGEDPHFGPLRSFLFTGKDNISINFSSTPYSS